MNTECAICADRFNKTIHAPVSCNFCSFEACKACCTRFITESYTDPACMSCKKEWSMDFMTDAFSKSFVNTKLKMLRENLLYEREKGLMPATQSYVERLIQERELIDDMKELRMQKRELKQKLYQGGVPEAKRIEIAVEMGDITWQLTKLSLKREALQLSEKTEVVEKREFVRQCPGTECKGFLSTQWKCGLCGLKACSKCHEIKVGDEEHVCKLENVETAKLIAKESKPCPNCSIPICKISGCSQMFCTSCHTPWDWNTGKLVRGPIHNPHYYEMLRQGGLEVREHVDVPCGGFPTLTMFNGVIKGVAGRSHSPYYCSKLHGLTHMWEVDAFNFRQNAVMDNIELRAKFMMNEIDEAKFKQLLQQRDKAARKKVEYYSILNTLRDVSLDLLNSMMQAATKEELQKLDEDLVKVWIEADKCMGLVAGKYNCKKPELPDWMMETAVNNYKKQARL